MKNIKTLKIIRLSIITLFMSIGVNFLQAQTTTYTKTSNSLIEGEWQEMRHLFDNKKGVLFTVEGDTIKMRNQSFKILSSNTFKNDEKNTVSFYCLSKDELGRMTKIVVFQYGSYYRVSVLQRDIDFNQNYYTVMYAVKMS